MRTTSVLLAATFAIAAAATVQAQDKDTSKSKGKADFSQPELRAKIDYCKTCHGLSGQGFRGSYPMPRLAGQQPEYLENQLQAFIERRRTNPVMFNVAHVLSPSMLTALAAHFRDLNPKPLGGAPKELVAAGKQIYEEGVSSAEVPPCATCHGPDAKAADALPRLPGHFKPYVYLKTTTWE